MDVFFDGANVTMALRVALPQPGLLPHEAEPLSSSVDQRPPEGEHYFPVAI